MDGAVARCYAAIGMVGDLSPHRLRSVPMIASDLVSRNLFVRWTISGATGVPSWDDALTRLQDVPPAGVR